MSTYYYMVCKECNCKGGFLSRQAWGIGNFEIISTFKFMALHRDHKPVLMSEHDIDGSMWDDSDAPETSFKFLRETHGIMPRSGDWSIINNSDYMEDAESIWEKQQGYVHPKGDQ